MKKENNLFKYSVEDLVETAILTSLAIVFDLFVKFPLLPNGGSINIAMVPLFIIAIRKGWFKAFVSGALVFGFLTCVIDGYGLVTYPLDYFVGFGSVTIIGLFYKHIKLKENKVSGTSYLFIFLGVFFSYLIRFTGSLISGVVIYGLTLEGSAIYQLTYMSPSFAITFALLVILLKPILLIYRRRD